jgi:hypothetical protein
MNQRLGLLLTLLGAAVAVGCGGGDSDAELRALVASAEEAAEAHDTGFFRALVASSYADRSGRGRDDLINLVRGHFLVNGDLEVLNRIEQIRLDTDTAAEVVLQAALIRHGGRAVDGGLYRIELELVKADGEWQLIGADWKPILE